MSDAKSLSDRVAENVAEQVDTADLLGEGSIEDELDAEELGTAVGADVGERAGRLLGEAIGEAIHEAVATGLDEGKELRAIADDVRTAVRDATADTLREMSDRSGTAVGQAAAAVGASGALQEPDESDADESESDESDAGELDADDERTESEGREVSEPEDETEAEQASEAGDDGEADSAPDEAESDEDVPDPPDSPEGFEDMTYRELQLLAKDTGVKANLARDVLVDRLTESLEFEER